MPKTKNSKSVSWSDPLEWSGESSKSSSESDPKCSPLKDANAERELLLRRSGDLTGPFSDEVLLSLGVCEFNKLTFGIPKDQVTPMGGASKAAVYDFTPI